MFISDSGEPAADYSDTEFGTTSFGDDRFTGDKATEFKFAGYWSTCFRIEFSRFYFRITVFRIWG